MSSGWPSILNAFIMMIVCYKDNIFSWEQQILGAGNSVSTETGTVNVTLGNNCTWMLTADTYITSLKGDTSHIKVNGHRLFVGGKELISS